MNVTAHCRERYIERIQGITDNSQIKQLAKENIEDIELKVMNIYGSSQIIYEGSLCKGQPKRKFLVSEDIVLVTDVDDSNIRTLYKVDFGFPSSTNKKVLDDLLENIRILQSELELKKLENDDDICKKETEIELIDIELESLEKQMKLLNGKRSVLKQSIQNRKEELEIDRLEIEQLCKMICNSLNYKKDLLVE